MHKVLKAVPGLVYPPLILSGFSLVLLFSRVLYNGSDRFMFMAWNLLLAWLPLLWAWLLAKQLKSGRWLSPKGVVLSFLWLSFLPNSFYLVTDLIHLHSSASGSLLFDAVMLMSFSLAGIIIGCTSTYLMHRQFMKRFDASMTWMLMLILFALSGLAIYLGRNLGWNSWDLLANPLFILFDLSNRFSSTDRLSVTFGVTLLFFLFISVCYTAFYTGVRAVKRAK